MKKFRGLLEAKSILLTHWDIVSKNWLIHISNKFVFVLFVLSIGLLVWKYNQLPTEIPIWYSKPWGDDRLAHPIWLFILPFGSMIIYFINLFLYFIIAKHYLIFSQILFIGSLLVHILSFITLSKVIFLVT